MRSRTIVLAVSVAVATGFGTMFISPSPAAAQACVEKEFKTELTKEACAKGGQKAAKEAMMKFIKENKIKSCNLCHAKLGPRYELKPDGLEQFHKLGGK